jgi:hypothetical protein
MFGKWQLWHPLTETSGEYYIKSHHDDFENLKFVLSKYETENNTEIHVTFKSGFEAYRKTNESYRLRLWAYLDETHSDLERAKWPLLIVEDSEYLKFLSEESASFSDYVNHKHYCIMDSEWIFDIASQQQPRVDLIIGGELVERSECRWHDE